jgi:hypothetical protein
MGAVEHLKALCCLGLTPESAMVAVVPVLHEIIPHGGSRLALVAPDATITTGYSENPESGAVFRERLWRFMDGPSSLMSLWVPGVRAVAIGWALHRQGGDYLESGYYREIEVPLDSCWLLDAMIGDGGRTIGFVSLTRPRSARPFTVDDVQRLDGLRPWLAHAFRRSPSGDSREEDEAPIAGATVLSGQVVLTSEGRIVYQTSGVELLLRILTGEPSNYTRYVEKKRARPHQIEALAAVREGLHEADRGKLIMACGTGKTYTGLQIAEAMACKGGRVLFLVPPLSLMSQTIREWSIDAEIPLRSFAVCSDTQVGVRKAKDGDLADIDIHDLEIPATTHGAKLAAKANSHDPDRMTAVFSTYQSIQAIHDTKIDLRRRTLQRLADDLRRIERNTK